MSVSVIVLTLNEASNILTCLNTLSWSDDVIVLDSNSTDRTAELAQSAGARVICRQFDNWSAHQNWAVKNLEFRNPWVLYLDADERCTPELRDEVVTRATPNATESAFRLRRRDFFMGRWLKHAQLYPTWFIRLFRPERIRYERLVNPVAHVDGVIGAIEQDIYHYPFSHGISHWIDRHNRYSEFEAQEMLKTRANLGSKTGRLFAGDPNERRRALKELFLKMPARPLLKFAYCYFARRGFLDGRPGFTYCALQSYYEFMIDCKYHELLRRKQGLPI
ncbi:MAG: glycosyltransferase family 2 protein [Nitrospira sp.]